MYCGYGVGILCSAVHACEFTLNATRIGWQLGRIGELKEEWWSV